VESFFFAAAATVCWGGRGRVVACIWFYFDWCLCVYCFLVFLISDGKRRLVVGEEDGGCVTKYWSLFYLIFYYFLIGLSISISNYLLS